MGVSVNISGRKVPLDYSLTEGSTPLAGGDSTGNAGEISVTIPHAAENILLMGQSGTFKDTERGETEITVRQIDNSRDDATDELTMTTRLGKLNINADVKPHYGNLYTAVEYLLSIGGITDRWVFDDPVSSTEVSMPGFSGNLWTNIKDFCAAYRLDISQVEDIIYVRPVRLSRARRAQSISRSITATSQDIAQNVEVKYYNNEYKIDFVVWPDQPVNSDTQVMSVSANEIVEYDLELSSSLESIKQPECVGAEIIGPYYEGSRSVYSVVGEDGIPVTAEQWAAQGGRVEVTIDDDTKNLHVKLYGPSEMVNESMERVTSFSLAYSDGDNKYSSLRLVGTGVDFEEKTLRVSTGVSEALTSQEVGETVENPFLSSLDQAWTVAKAMLPFWNGNKMSISDTSVKIATEHSGAVSNQDFGNIGGARVYDRELNRWFRVRDATITPANVRLTCEDDETYDDFYRELELSGITTYDEFQEAFGDLTNQQVFLYGPVRARDVRK